MNSYKNSPLIIKRSGYSWFLLIVVFLISSFSTELYSRTITYKQMKKYFSSVYSKAKTFNNSVKSRPSSDKQKQLSQKIIKSLQIDGKKIQSYAKKENTPEAKKDFKKIAGRLKKTDALLTKLNKNTSKNKKPNENEIKKQIADYNNKIKQLESELEKKKAVKREGRETQINDLMANRQYKEALSLTDKQIIEKPDESRWHYKKAQCHYELGEYYAAKQAIKEALRLESVNSNYWVFSGKVREAIRERPAAYSAFSEALKLNPGNWKARMGIAELLFEDGYEDSAETIYIKAEKAQSELFQAYSGIAKVSQKRHNLERSKTYYQKALALQNTDINTLLKLGLIYMEENQNNYAIEYFDKVIKLRPENLEARFQAGMAHFKRDDMHRTIFNWEFVYEKNETFDDIRFWLPVAYFVYGEALNAQKNYKESTRLYQKALKINPESYYWLSYANFWLGDESRRQKHYRDAEKYFNKSLEINPRSTESYFGLGMLYWDLQNYDAAKKYWEQVLSINPDHQNAQSWLTLLRSRIELY